MSVTKSEEDGNHGSGNYLVVEDHQHSSTWHLRVRDADGKLNHRLMGAAWAALHGGYRGNKYEGPHKAEALRKLTGLYHHEGLPLPGSATHNRAPILNRDFQHPADGWYHIEPKGNHPNRRSQVLQVIDDQACEAIVNRFNADANAGRLSHGHEMLIDHEHFKHDSHKESRAYGWLQQLQNRQDGFYGKIRWTGTGKQAVDEGDYRFFSTEYDPGDLQVINDGKPRHVRPMRLDGLTLTNDPNNKGARPITNRTAKAPLPDDHMCPDCDCALMPADDGDQDDMSCPQCGKIFAGPDGQGSSSPSAANQQTNNRRKKTMKSIATKLGLAAEASEDAILEALTKVQNRNTTLEPLAAENKTLKEKNESLLGEQVEALMDAHGIKTDDKVRNRLKPVLIGLTNREDRTAALVEFGFKLVEAPKPGEGQRKLFNRDTNTPTGRKGDVADTKKADEALAQKIQNRAAELKKQTPNLSDASAIIMAQREIEATA